MLADLAGLVAALNGGSVRYVVIGGVAVAAHGAIRATEDLDISREHLIEMKRARGSLQDQADIEALEAAA